jgi:hypothetical protein
MTRIERIYRMRRNLLICAFVCSCLLFIILCFPKPFDSFAKAYPWRYFSNPFLLVLQVVGILAATLLVFLLGRFIVYRTSTRKDPDLREAVDDERIRAGWLRAYGAAFYVMAGIHLVYLFIEGPLFQIGLPAAAWTSSSAGLMVLFSAAVFYTREVRHG